MNKAKQFYGSVKNKAAVAGGLALLGTQAFAVGADYTPITTGVDVSTVVTAMIGMGAVMILPNVAKWATKKLAAFF